MNRVSPGLQRGRALGPAVATLCAVLGTTPLGISGVAHAEEPLWSNEVRTIDRASQSFERLPDKRPQLPASDVTPGAFRLNGFFRIHDSVSFSYKGARYRLDGVSAIPNGSICTRADGARLACGLEARTALQRLIKARGTSCVPVGDAGAETRVRCGTSGRDVARSLVASGFATADNRLVDAAK